MAANAERTLARRRQQSRVSLLKKRATIASLLGFGALFGLAAQHVVKGANAASKVSTTLSSARAPSHTTFFDETESGFSFDGQGLAPSQSPAPQVQASTSPPVAQSSVS